MKRLIPKQKAPIFNSSIDDLLVKTKEWISEIEFIKTEQFFLIELLSEHIVGVCQTNNFKKAKFLLQGLNLEKKIGEELMLSVKDHSVNLSLLIENIYLKREDNFRNSHEYINTEVKNYIENFKYLKEQVFDLVLLIMEKNKQEKLVN